MQQTNISYRDIEETFGRDATTRIAALLNGDIKWPDNRQQENA